MAQKTSNTPVDEKPIEADEQPVAITADTELSLICSEFLATRHENVNLLKLFRTLTLKKAGLPEFKVIKTLPEWEKEFNEFIK